MFKAILEIIGVIFGILMIFAGIFVIAFGLTVTNMMYEDRFCISGKTGEGNVEYLMAYTEEDLENILKVLDIYDYYKKEC